MWRAGMGFEIENIKKKKTPAVSPTLKKPAFTFHNLGNIV